MASLSLYFVLRKFKTWENQKKYLQTNSSHHQKNFFPFQLRLFSLGLLCNSLFFISMNCMHSYMTVYCCAKGIASATKLNFSLETKSTWKLVIMVCNWKLLSSWFVSFCCSRIWNPIFLSSEEVILTLDTLKPVTSSMQTTTNIIRAHPPKL